MSVLEIILYSTIGVAVIVYSTLTIIEAIKTKHFKEVKQKLDQGKYTKEWLENIHRIVLTKGWKKNYSKTIAKEYQYIADYWYFIDKDIKKIKKDEGVDEKEIL